MTWILRYHELRLRLIYLAYRLAMLAGRRTMARRLVDMHNQRRDTCVYQRQIIAMDGCGDYCTDYHNLYPGASPERLQEITDLQERMRQNETMRVSDG